MEEGHLVDWEAWESFSLLYLFEPSSQGSHWGEADCGMGGRWVGKLGFFYQVEEKHVDAKTAWDEMKVVPGVVQIELQKARGQTSECFLY